MIGFPEFILDPKELDDVYDGVSDSLFSLSIFRQAGHGDRSIVIWVQVAGGALLPPAVKHRDTHAS